MAKLGTIEIFNAKETMNKSVQVTEYEVEKGSPFSDHVRRTNPSFSVSGYIFSETWGITEQNLEKAMNSGTIMKYVGKFTVSDVIIEDYNIGGDKQTANGVELNLSLRKIRITQTSYVNAPKKEIPQRKPLTNAGEKKQTGTVSTGNPTGVASNTAKYHTIKKGDTYWYCSKKYGVSVDWLIKNNPWAPTRLPVGAKMKVG